MARQKSGTLAFRNPDQKVLFDCELSGQLSDGQWENTEPYDHWEAWCNAETIVATDIGRDFDVKKQGYGFTRKEFLGDPTDPEAFDLAERAMGYVRVARTFGYDIDVRSAADYDEPQDWMSEATKALVASIDQKQKVAVMADASIYDRNQLVADLRDINVIMKTDVRVGADGFYRTPGRRRDEIHVGSCPKVSRLADWKRIEVPRSQLAESVNRPYGDTLHDCIPLDTRRDIGREWNVAREADIARTRRRNLLIKAAVAKVAADRLADEVGSTTTDEATLFAEYVKQIRGGQFRPHSVPDLREVAFGSVVR